MRSLECQVADDVARLLEEIAAEREVKLEDLLVSVLTRYARREADKKFVLTPEMIAAMEEAAEEDRQLAEAGMEDRARLLEEEDRA